MYYFLTPPHPGLCPIGISEKKSDAEELEKLKDPFNKEGLSEVETDKISQIQREIDDKLKSLSEEVQTSENTTTFEGVLEHFQEHNPDILIVFRRKRGFFTKLWEKNIILKREFRCSIPLLILSVKK